jgi:hypothetical protein
VSFDIFFQHFEEGDAAPMDMERVLDILRPMFAEPPDGGFVRLRTTDGEADVYGLHTEGLMVNHAGGRAIWDVFYELAAKASLAIMPVGCPTCVASEAGLRDLPEELRKEARVVRDGAELLASLEEG